MYYFTQLTPNLDADTGVKLKRAYWRGEHRCIKLIVQKAGFESASGNKAFMVWTRRVGCRQPYRTNSSLPMMLIFGVKLRFLV
jgi:hypothetical protein